MLCGHTELGWDMSDGLRKSHYDPFWNKKNGRISEAFEKCRCVITNFRAFSLFVSARATATHAPLLLNAPLVLILYSPHPYSTPITVFAVFLPFA